MIQSTYTIRRACLALLPMLLALWDHVRGSRLSGSKEGPCAGTRSRRPQRLTHVCSADDAFQHDRHMCERTDK